MKTTFLVTLETLDFGGGDCCNCDSDPIGKQSSNPVGSPFGVWQKLQILQGLRVDQAAVTERWP